MVHPDYRRRGLGRALMHAVDKECARRGVSDYLLVGEAAYPHGAVIHPDFAAKSWLLIRKQWIRAGHRLARILNAVVGEGEVEPGSEKGSG